MRNLLSCLQVHPNSNATTVRKPCRHTESESDDDDMRDPGARHIPEASGRTVEAALRVILIQAEAGPQELLRCQVGQQERKNWEPKCQIR